ncbi:MAG: ATP-binding protein [Deltaproteobacteria bacterium]|nr:ATP-binding protein [Deltaproteobacteria bacterium]
MFNTLKSKITIIISLTVLIGGLIASAIGTYTVRNTLKNQAYEKIRHDIQSAFALYQSEGEKIRSIINLIAENIKIKNDPFILNDVTYINKVKSEHYFDFLTIVDSNGLDIYEKKKLPRAESIIKNIRNPEFSETLSVEDIAILTRADQDSYSIKIIDTERAYPEDRSILKEVLCISSMSSFEYSGKIYYLYGGIILNKNFDFVDKIREIIFSGEFHRGKPVGTVTIFSGPIRIATNVLLNEKTRAIGTVIQDIVGETLLEKNKEFIGRAFVVNSWYLGAYRLIPTRDQSKAILYVGLSESVYMSIQYNLVLRFLFVAIISFVLIIIFSYVLVSKITKPIENLAQLSENISSGDFSKRAEISTNDELGRLAKAFNHMVESISSSHKMLEEYNITLQRKVQERTEELMKIKEQMIQSEKLASIGRLSAGIAHEINNPLSAILSYAHLIKEELIEKNDAKEILNFTNNIISETNRTKNIIKSLLEFSRQHKTEYEWVDINQIIEDTINLITLQKNTNNIEIIKEYGKDIPIVKIDSEKIREAIINIVINAMDAIGEKGKIIIKTAVDHKRKTFSISVKDTGPGIPPDVMGHIFEPFFTTKPVGQGTGLGLSVTYGIVKQHNGEILVDSKVGEGATFTIILPLHP